MEFQLGETYSGYQFLDILKRSKNGVEFRVRNTQAGRVEALRALPRSAQDDPEQTDRFLREMRVHASLLHPNIVTLFSATTLEKQLVMTTELVEGTTLAERLQLGPMPWQEAVALTRQAISALAYAHGQNVIHRDINPDNITITADGVLKLANFALAKGVSSPKLTQVGRVVGNLKYISPEQIKALGDVDARSDIYSLAMVLYQMLCGRPAFDFESQFELMAAQVQRAPVPPDALNPAIPHALSMAVVKALAKDPAARYQTAAEFESALIHAAGAPEPAPAEVTLEPAAGLLASQAEERFAPVEVAPVPSPRPAPRPDPATAGSSYYLPVKQLILGSAAGASVAVILVTIWLLVK